MLRIVRQPLAEAKPESLPRVPPLLQLCGLSLGLLQDRDVEISVFPEGEEVFVGGQRAAVAIAHKILVAIYHMLSQQVS
jgi:hypothetical protein